jgi:soluble lytic murein transglycosylase-like protein
VTSCTLIRLDRARLRALLVACVFATLPAPGVHASSADQQRDPELKSRLQHVIDSGDCFSDKFDSVVWFKTMEPRLKRFVPSHDVRLEILNHVYCEAGRDPQIKLPPDLIMALIEVESRFDNWAVSSAGAVGLMQVMPFWPRQLGVQNQLVRVAPNIRMGCEILRYYLQAEHGNWPRALGRYNGKVGRGNPYPATVMARWQRAWRF